MAETSYAFAALLTTGPAPGEDRVLEVAAVRDRGGQQAEFARLADPGQICAAVRALTGLRAADLRGRPAPRDALAALFAFCGGDRLVVHDEELFAAFLEAEGVRPPPCLDLIALARVALPTAADYALEALAGSLGLEAPAERRALPRARLAGDVWRALAARLAALPPAALHPMCRVAESAAHPLAPVLADAAAGKEGFELAADEDANLAGIFASNSELLRRAQKHESPEPGEAPVPTDGICRMFSPGGPVGRLLPGYEQRPEQVEMARAVCEAFNAPHHLLAEAGTGTGKSLAYLMPAVAWTCTNEDKVVVSTNTRNLQEQLYRKDVPFLAELLPDRFEAALLKGRRNYLCVRRVVHLMRHFELELGDPAEMAALLPLVAWAARTQSGDLAQCSGLLMEPAAPAVIGAVVSGPDECLGRACRFRSRCFVARARALAQLADLIVVNHALLFAEIGIDSPVLPPYRCVVFDEAQNLEDVATEALATAVDGLGVYRVTNRLYRSRRDGSGSGLLATVMHRAGRAGGSSARLTGAGGAAMRAIDDVVQAARQFFEVIGEPFQELPPSIERVMLRECCPDLGRGSAAWDAAERLRETARSLGEKVEATAEALDVLADRDAEAADLAVDLRAQVARLREVCEAALFVLAQQEEDCVYWLQRTTRERGAYYSVHAAPVRIGEHIRRFLLDEKRCVIFTSATLRVGGSFDYVMERLGADELAAGHLSCVAVGSPFDYDRQSLVGVSTFLPDPGGRRDRTFDTELASFLIELLQCTRGRALVLFTSYSLLDAVYESIKEPLRRAGIMVLAQGHSGSREAVTSLFRTVESSVLLGTRSFWEGVDVAGEALSCLVLTKLPFHVFTDPLVRGRTEHLQRLGKDPFVHYTLPEAVISFRQGFGRLIRNRTDTGVVIVTDRRLVTRGYGRTFLSSLPTRHRVFRKPAEALEAVRAFFARAGG